MHFSHNEFSCISWTSSFIIRASNYMEYNIIDFITIHLHKWILLPYCSLLLTLCWGAETVCIVGNDWHQYYCNVIGWYVEVIKGGGHRGVFLCNRRRQGNKLSLFLFLSLSMHTVHMSVCATIGLLISTLLQILGELWQIVNTILLYINLHGGW